MKAIDWIYVALAVLGIAVPWAFNITWMLADPSPGPFGFVVDATANAAASSISIDIAIACVTFFIWMGVEARRLSMTRRVWWLVPYALLGAFASAFPLFLLLRSRHISKIEAATTGS